MLTDRLDPINPSFQKISPDLTVSQFSREVENATRTVHCGVRKSQRIGFICFWKSWIIQKEFNLQENAARTLGW